MIFRVLAPVLTVLVVAYAAVTAARTSDTTPPLMRLDDVQYDHEPDGRLVAVAAAVIGAAVLVLILAAAATAVAAVVITIIDGILALS